MHLNSFRNASAFDSNNNGKAREGKSMMLAPIINPLYSDYLLPEPFLLPFMERCEENEAISRQLAPYQLTFK